MARELPPLEQCITQYGVLKAIASGLSSTDLLNLARVSKATWTAILDSQQRWKNLTSVTHCDSFGLQCRADAMNTQYSRPQNPPAKCGADAKGIVSKLCEECSFMTCEECRTHITYKSTICTSKCYDEYHLGFIALPGLFLNPTDPRALLSRSAPQHTKAYRNDKAIWIFEHFIRAPHRTDTVYIEMISHLGDLPLGKREIYSGVFVQVVGMRKRYMCIDCSRTGGPGRDNAGEVVKAALERGGRIHRCKCALRKHFVERWICLRCAKAQYLRDEACSRNNPCVENVLPENREWDVVQAAQCACGACFEGAKNLMVYCGWCGGEVIARRSDTGVPA